MAGASLPDAAGEGGADGASVGPSGGAEHPATRREVAAAIRAQRMPQVCGATYAVPMTTEELRFRATIGVAIKGETWSCVEIPGSVEFFGTGKTVRVRAVIDDVVLDDVGAMVTGSGGHMVSLSAKVRKALGKDIGDTVDVASTRA